MVASTYDVPLRERYTFPPANAFGATTASISYQGPPGRKGLVRDIIMRVSASMVGTTSVPEIRVGIAASSNEFARWLLGTTAILGLGTGAYRARTLAAAQAGRTGGKPLFLTDFAHHICLEGNDNAGTVDSGYVGTSSTFVYLKADTAFFITGIAGVGGGIAGTADVFVDIDWW